MPAPLHSPPRGASSLVDPGVERMLAEADALQRGAGTHPLDRAMDWQRLRAGIVARERIAVAIQAGIIAAVLLIALLSYLAGGTA